MNAIETLNKIRQKYTCKGDIIFRSAIQNVVDCGQQTFKNNEWYEDALKEIDDRHDKAEAEGKWLWITRDFEKAIMECAKEISVVNTYELLMYIQKEVYFGSGKIGELDYQDAIERLQACVDHIEELEDDMTLEVLYDIGFDDDQIAFLGFEHLLDIEEE